MADGTWSATTKRLVKLVLTGLVLAFLVRHVMRVNHDLARKNLTLVFDPGRLAVAVGIYLAGLTAFGVYFWKVLAQSATPVAFFPAIRAYLVSHLAKYVPGKAMVVVVRSGLVAADGARPATAAFATLYETLVMMAAGGLVAAGGFAFSTGNGLTGPSGRFAEPWVREVDVDLPLVGMALGAGVGFLVLVWPSIFPRLAGLIRAPLRGVGADALPRLSVSLLGVGLAWATLGWVLLGMSQVMAIAAVGLDRRGGFLLPLEFWPVVVASVALATVAGFAVPVAPGGLGVREWVLWTALGSTMAEDRAVVAALVLRLVWVVGEVLAAGVLYAIRPRTRRAAG